jgi:hypothetical protein
MIGLGQRRNKVGYLSIPNLYKDQTILAFKECYALEKVHGTSAHISCDIDRITFFAGGCKHEQFVKLFEDNEQLIAKLKDVGDVTIYGEAYGGKILKMGKAYGPDLRFVAFDVKIGDVWLRVPDAAKFVEQCSLEFVDYKLVPTDLDALDAERDRDSVQAIRNGMGEGHKREGVVLRPVMEFITSNGSRVICKHKGVEFQETNTARKVVSLEQQQVLTDAESIALEWVTKQRLDHILSKMTDPSMSDMPNIIRAMIDDVHKEAIGEIVTSYEVEKAIGRQTAKLTKEFFQNSLRESQDERPTTNETV